MYLEELFIIKWDVNGRIIWRKMLEKFMFWFTWKLPKRLVYFCAIRVGAHATTGNYSNTVVPELTLMDAIKRWEDG